MFFWQKPLSVSSSNGFVNFNDADTGELVVEHAYVDVLDGWTNTPSPVVITAQKAIGDGAETAPRFYSQGRNLHVEGMVATSGYDQTEDAWNDLVFKGFPLNDDIQITAQGPIPKYVIGRVISQVSILQIMPDGFRFGVDLLCDDPWKYDAVNSLFGSSGIAGGSTGGLTWPVTWPLVWNASIDGIGNGVTLTNIGNADTLPEITISGPLDTGWRIENETTGEFLSFDVSLSAGQTLTIDSKTETASVDGSPVVGLVDGDWFPLRPGANLIKLFGNYDPETSFTVYALSAWR